MTVVNVIDAKNHLSRLIEAVETGREKEIIIARDGKPAARLVPIVSPIAPERSGQRIGVAKGRIQFDPEAFDALDEEVRMLFESAGDDE